MIFGVPTLYDSGGAMSFSIAIADLNGDGKLDLVVANGCTHSQDCRQEASTVGVLLGNGDGTFQPAQTYPIAGVLAIADVNGDGKPDIVTAVNCTPLSFTCDAGGAIGIRLGNGDGTFQDAVYYPSGGLGASSLAIADLNGDGKPDIAVSNTAITAFGPAGGVVGVLLNNGDGTFRSDGTYSVGSNPAASLAIADLNGDGKPDIVVASSCPTVAECDPNVEVLLGNGDGTFLSAAFYSSGGFTATSVAIGDFNGDGKPDIVVSNSSSCVNVASCPSGNGAVGVLLGNGDGTFQSPVSYASGGFNANFVTTVDANGDGILDLVVLNECADSTCTGGGIGVLLGNRDGTFQTAATQSSGINSSFPGAVAAADLNADGKQDVAIAQGCVGSADCVGVLLNIVPSSPHTTMTNVTSDHNPATAGQTVTFSATVTSSPAGAPSGTVTFDDGPTILGTANLNSSGIASFSTASLSVGVHSIGVVYGGAANFAGSSSGAIEQVIVAASGPAATLSTNALKFSSQTINSTSVAQSVTLTNTGTANLTISSIVASGNFTQTNNCPASLSANTNCAISVKFTPTATGIRNGTIAIADNASSSPQAVSLNGIGIVKLFGPPSQPVPTTMHLSADHYDVPETGSSSTTITATLLDQQGNAVAGTLVTFAASSGLLSPSSAQTDVNGQAAVTLAPTSSSPSLIISSVTATVGNLSNTINIHFIPPGGLPTNWDGSAAFNVNAISLSMEQALSTTLGLRNNCILAANCSGPTVPFGNLTQTANFYFLTPKGSQATFAQALSQYFGITQCTADGQAGCIPSEYNPAAVLIVEFPFTPVCNVLFDSNLSASQSLGLGNSALLVNPIVNTTAAGNIDLAFTIGGASANVAQTVTDLQNVLLGDLTAIVKQGASSVTSALLDQLKLLLDMGDVTISVITTDLSQSGPLGSYVLFDLSFVKTLLNDGGTIDSIVGKIFFLMTGAAQTAVAAATSDPLGVVPAVRTAVTLLDLGIDIVGTAVPSLQQNNLFQVFQNSADAITSIIDPPGSTIVPSIYDSNGTLVLGYDPTNGSINYVSSSGILFQAGDSYFAYLSENTTTPSKFSQVLTATGQNIVLPYDSQIYSYVRSQPPELFAGMLAGQSSVTLPVVFNASSGALTPQTYLKPTVSVQQDGSTSTISATAVLSDGSATTATQAFLILNGQQSAMAQENASTFGISIGNSSSTPTSFTVYMIAPNIPAGFVSGILPAVVPAVSLPTLPVNFSSQNIGTTSAPQSIALANTGNANLAITGISIAGANSGDFAIATGGSCPTSGGTLSNGMTCIINVDFAPAVPGTKAAALTVVDNAPGSPHTVALAGLGVGPVVSLPTAPLTFLGQIVGTSSTSQSVMLSNSGNANLSITGISISGTNGSDFALAGGGTCPVAGGIVNSSASCTVSLKFAPTTTGTRSATIVIADSALPSPQSISLTGTATDFSLSAAAGGSTSATVTAGQAAMYNLQVSPSNGMTGPVTLSCVGAPSLASCSPSSGLVTVNGTTSNFTVSVTTTANSGVQLRTPREIPPGATDQHQILLLLTIAVSICVFFVASKQIKSRPISLILCVLFVLLTLTSCGGAGVTNPPVVTPGTPTGSFTLTVSGTSGGATRNLSLSLTVK